MLATPELSTFANGGRNVQVSLIDPDNVPGAHYSDVLVGLGASEPLDFVAHDPGLPDRPSNRTHQKTEGREGR